MANYVFNSSSSGETYNAKCLNASDDSEWTPSVSEYPQDGTIDLSGGTSGRYLDTGWEAPQNTEWTMSGIYNVVMGVSYDMYSIHYKGNQTCDIYLGSSTEDLVLSESDKDYTPPTGNWIIEEEPPAIINPVANTFISLTANVSTVTEIIAGDTYDIDFVSTSDTKLYYLLDFTEVTSVDLILKFNWANTSGTLRFDSYYDGTGYIPLPDGEHIFTEGANSINLGSRANSDTAMLRASATLTGAGRMSSITVEKV